ncbi:hypothetical protein ACHAWO_004512 [Cyclotella atomus]|uniref:Uncharacterized protein n=1 Tax=Cyclotella atomus TaxID=382360 RepID=A0ABD3NEG1_9STRA
MIGSLISYVYSIFNHYAYTLLGQRQPLSASISNLSTRDRESLLCEVSNSLYWHLSGVGDVGLGSSLEDGKGGEPSVDEGVASAIAELETALDQCRLSLGVASAIAELETALDQCRLSLVKFEQKERFVSMRIQKYRMMIDQRNERANQDTVGLDEDLEHDNFVKSENQVRSSADKWDKDEMTLQSVEQVHKNIIADMEVLRRRIRELEEKKEIYLGLREECRDFVLAAAADDC